MNQRSIALIAVFTATLIYGVTFTIAKDVMPLYVKPFGLIVIRVLGATIFFWLLTFFIKKENVAKADLIRIFFAAFFGVALNMLTFFKGLSLTNPISASVVMVTSPIMVLLFSSLLLKEPIQKRKIIGVIIGLLGTVLLILFGTKADVNSSNPALGNFLVFINASSYGLYLVLVKRIIPKYNPITFVKWLYLFGLFLVIPFGYEELKQIDTSSFSTEIYLKIGFIVFFTTCVTYLFNLYGLRKLKPTTVSVFIYLQPVIASIFALTTGKDKLSLPKIIAAFIIFTGVYLVTIQPKKASK